MIEKNLKRAIQFKHFLDNNIDVKSPNNGRRYVLELGKKISTVDGLYEQIFEESLSKEIDCYAEKPFQAVFLAFNELFMDNGKHLKVTYSYSIITKKKLLSDDDMRLLNSYYRIKFEDITSVDEATVLKNLYSKINDHSTEIKYKMVKRFLDYYGQLHTGSGYSNGTVLQQLVKYAEIFLNEDTSYRYSQHFVRYIYFHDSKKNDSPYMSLVNSNSKRSFCIIEYVEDTTWGEGKYDSCNIKELISEDSLLEQYIQKLLIGMISHKTNFRILTDSRCFFFIQIPMETMSQFFFDLKDIDKTTSNIKDIPLKIIDFEQLEAYLKKPPKRRQLEFQDALFVNKKSLIKKVFDFKNRSIQVPKQDFEIMQYGKRFCSHLLKINASYLAENLLGGVEPDHKVVVKCYSPLTEEKVMEDYCDVADREREVYGILSEEPEFNYIYKAGSSFLGYLEWWCIVC